MAAITGAIIGGVAAAASIAGTVHSIKQSNKQAKNAEAALAETKKQNEIAQQRVNEFEKQAAAQRETELARFSELSQNLSNKAPQEVQTARKRQSAITASKGGRSSTILTGPLGVSSARATDTSGRKSILGG